jgi:glycosyltransferase involved in cell wall biosynthesis
MNVLMLTYSFYESDNRVRRYAETLARRGDSVDIISIRPKDTPVFNSLNGVNVYRIQEREVNESHLIDYLLRLTFFLVKSFFFTCWMQLKKRYRFVHVHSVPDYEVFAALLPKLTGAKVILDIHDIVPEFYASKFSGGRKSLLMKILKLVEKLSCFFADHVIISNHIWYERITERSVSKNKCTVFINYVDPFIFKKEREPVKKDDFVVIYPGTIAWHQGIDLAVQAMARVVKTHPDIKFHIYGKGSEVGTIKKLISDLHLENAVTFFGMIPIDDIVDKMIDADLGLVPKRNDPFGGEAFSTKIMEFMLMEVPVLIARTKIDQYYFDKDIVTFFECDNEADLAEKIVFMYENLEIRRKQVQKANVFIAKNTWDVKKSGYLDLVDKLTGKQ